jgi:hypothetical protein
VLEVSENPDAVEAPPREKVGDKLDPPGSFKKAGKHSRSALPDESASPFNEYVTR